MRKTKEKLCDCRKQVGSALSSSEAVQRWKYFWKSANALKRRSGMNLSSTGGDSNGTMVEAGRKKEFYYGEDMYFVPRFFGVDEFESSIQHHEQSSSGLESTILSSMTRGLDSANAFASVELERARTPSFHELDALGNEARHQLPFRRINSRLLSPTMRNIPRKQSKFGCIRGLDRYLRKHLSIMLE